MRSVRSRGADGARGPAIAAQETLVALEVPAAQKETRAAQEVLAAQKVTHAAQQAPAALTVSAADRKHEPSVRL